MYIGVDLGGTNIAVGIVDELGTLKYTDSTPTKEERGAQAVINNIKDLILKIIKDYGVSKDQIKAVGIGIPGLADQVTGDVIYCVNLKWNNIPLKKPLEEALDLPVYIDNDATVAGLAEYEAGVMKGAKSGIFITLGTGVGGGIVIDGKIHTGANGVGTEIGHMIVGENYYDCNCGKNGCLETFASATAINNYARKLIEEGNETIINEKINGDLDRIEGRVIFEAAAEGDKVANMVVDRLVKYLGIGIFNLINVIDPEIFVLGGGLSKAGTFLLDKVRTEVINNKYYKELPVGKIVLAELGNEAGIIGAAMLGKQHN